MVVYLTSCKWYILKLRQLKVSDEEIKQLLGLSYKTDLNKLLKYPR